MELSEIGVTSSKRKQFESKGIYTVEDLLQYMPRKYNDFSKLTGILPPDQYSCFQVKVISVTRRNGTHVPFIQAKCIELINHNTVYVNWFNMPWKYDSLSLLVDEIVLVVGKVNLYNGYTVANPEIFTTLQKGLGVYPVYSTIHGMSGQYLSEKLAAAIKTIHNGSHELLPPDILNRESELPMSTALRYIHCPKTMTQAEQGMKRILLNDLLYFSIHNELSKLEVSSGSQYNLKTTQLKNNIEADLPYKLTEDQNETITSMIKSAEEGRRINALVQGDVGCGKTIVCTLVAAAFIGSGYQVVLMAPTQVLAKQHYESIAELMKPYNIKLAYLDGAMKKKERNAVLKEISTGSAQMIIGTHSCIAKDVEYNNLALTIVDEEHKFGVKQRAAIVEKAAAGVHSITMSATPIPRSLAQIVYGDSMQLYTIHSMPNGRLPVITGIATDINRIYKFVLSQVKKHHQVYVVCPAIDKSEKRPEVQSVEEVYQDYQKVLGDGYGVRIATLTGKDSKEDTEKIIGEFKKGNTDILISTTVIEVGVNVPNATVMVITNAERFGLSQLHQLRGRVGRGDFQSYCVLYSNKASERLNILTQSTDGFEIAEADLQLRGAGDFLGTQQSGDNKYISLMLANPEKYKQATIIAKELINRGMDCCALTKRIAEERKEGK